MRQTKAPRIALLILLWALPGLPAQRGRLLSVRAGGDETTSVIELVGDRPLSFTTLRLSGPPRVVVDFADTELAGAPAYLSVEDGTVRRVGATQASARTARVVIELSGEAEFEVRARGSSLEVRLQRLAPRVAQAEPEPEPPPALVTAPREQEPREVRPEPARQPAAAQGEARPEERQPEPPMLIAQAEQLPAPARPAAPVHGASEAAPPAAPEATAQRSPEPTAPARAPRSAEVPPPPTASASASQSAAAPAPRAPAPAPAERSATREAQRAPPPATQREGAREPPTREPSDAEKRASLPTVALAGPNQHKPAAQRPAESAPPKPAAQEPAGPLTTQASPGAASPERGARPGESARAEPARAEHKPAAPTGRSAGLDPRKPALAAPSRFSITGIGFRQQGAGAVIVRSDRPLEYGVSGEEGAVVLHLPSARIPMANNRLPLDTSFFDGPVRRVVPLQTAAGVDLRIELREHAAYQLQQAGTVLTLTFERP